MIKGLTTASILLGIVFLIAGGALLAGSEAFRENFERWGYPLWFMYVTGAIEVLGALLVFVPRTRFYGSALLVCTMAGAVLTHLRAGEITMLPAPVVLLALSTWIAWTTRLRDRA